MNTQPKAIIVQGGAGNHFTPETSIVLSGEQTRGTLAVLIFPDEPGPPGPPLHVHANDDELFLITEGEYRFYADGDWTDVGVGAVVYLPKGVAHCYYNSGTTTARHWTLTTPSGFERFLPRFVEEMAKPNGPDRGRIAEISREYGIEILGEQPPETKAPR
jgi:mannose-6-phosphate isomerase-like protein (cupin superfamily)